MTDQEREQQLHAEAVRVVQEAEAEMEAIFERSDVQSAEAVSESDQEHTDDGRHEAEWTVESARERAEVIANRAMDRVTELMNAAHDPAEAERLRNVLHASIDDPRPGIRFSERISELENEDLTGIEEAALRVEGGLNAIMNPFFEKLEHDLEDLDKPDEHQAQQFEHALHSDEVDLFGNHISVPGGLYTVVFGVLAAVTIVEVIIAESPLPNAIGFPLLAALSIGKAVLVVLYYMHLREDSRIFVWSFGLPLAMAALIIIFLLVMSPFGY